MLQLEQSSLNISSLELKSLEENSELITELHGLFAENKKDYFFQLNQAFLEQGLVFKVTGSDVKLELDFQWKSQSPTTACFSKNYIVVEPGASLSLTEKHETAEGAVTFASPYCDVLLKRDAHMRYKKNIVDSTDLHQISCCRFYLEENARLESFYVSLGGKFYRQDAVIKLAGRHAEAFANGLYLAGTKQSSDYSFVINHASPDAKSHQYFKGVCAGSGKGVFQGTIVVAEGASQTAAKQLNKNLLLSDEAKVYTKPQLKIDTDDVKCAHGATVSQIRDDELFYLQTRGLNKAEATSF